MCDEGYVDMNNKERINRLVIMGKIPKDAEMTDQQFREYDELISLFEDSISYDEAEQLILLFSDDCDDLNWGLVHLIETVPFNEGEKYKQLITMCPNLEYREILEKRHNKKII